MALEISLPRGSEFDMQGILKLNYFVADEGKYYGNNPFQHVCGIPDNLIKNIFKLLFKRFFNLFTQLFFIKAFWYKTQI